MNENPNLSELCAALGWQGGTIHQVIEEVKRLKTLEPAISTQTEEGQASQPVPDEPQFAIVELMGHVRLAGRISEVEMFGSKMGRIDILDGDSDSYVTQYFAGGSVYRITPVAENIARSIGKTSPPPVQPWEIKPLPEPVAEPSNWPYDEEPMT